MKLLILVLVVVGLFAGANNVTSAEYDWVTWEQLRVEAEELTKQQSYQQKLVERANSLKGRWLGQCVIGARKFLEVDSSVLRGAAISNKPNSRTPEIGSILITRDSRSGHAQVVIAITETTLTVFDSNWGWDGRGRVREIPINYSRIVGYITIKK